MSDEIDIVIPWVDGSDPVLEAKRGLFLPRPENAVGELELTELTSPIRWENNDELYFCLRSIHRFAPWVRRIHLVTDGQKLPAYDLPEELLNKITVVDHTVVFRDFLDCLPCFNSAAIGAATVFIPDLSKKYILFNDDIFFLKPVKPTDFFDSNGSLVIRGVFNQGKMMEGLMWTFHRRNAAALVGFDLQSMFTQSHSCHGIDLDMVRGFFSEHPNCLRENLSHRIRHESQFIISALSIHLAIKNKTYVLPKKPDWAHVAVELCKSGSASDVKKAFDKFLLPASKIGCVNDLSSLDKRTTYPRKVLEKIIFN